MANIGKDEFWIIVQGIAVLAFIGWMTWRFLI